MATEARVRLVGLKRKGPFYCPVCGALGRVIDTGEYQAGATVRRRRCLACDYRWTSEERPALTDGEGPSAAGGANRGGKRVSRARYYLGFREPLGSDDTSDTCLVYALAQGGSWGKVYLRRGLKHYHSPTGFNWGYGGSGPAELARHLLAHATGQTRYFDRPDLYQDFKAEVVVKMPKIWMLSGDFIREWAAEHDHGDPNQAPA